MKTEAEGEGCGHKPAGAGNPRKLGEAGKTPPPPEPLEGGERRPPRPPRASDFRPELRQHVADKPQCAELCCSRRETDPGSMPSHPAASGWTPQSGLSWLVARCMAPCTTVHSFVLGPFNHSEPLGPTCRVTRWARLRVRVVNTAG